MSDLEFQVIIPARKGSKRFPGKNKVDLCGKPLIQYSIEFALDSGVAPQNIWVNSDDEDLLALAATFQVNSYLRNENLAGDYSSTASVLEDQVSFFKKEGIGCDAVILLQVTNPLRPISLLRDAMQVYHQSGRSSLATFSTLNKKFGAIESNHFIPRNYSPGQRMQDLEPLYFENGLLYISSSDLLLEQHQVIGDDVFPMVINHPYCMIDIDEPEDLLLAKYFIENNLYVNL